MVGTFQRRAGREAPPRRGGRARARRRAAATAARGRARARGQRSHARDGARAQQQFEPIVIGGGRISGVQVRGAKESGVSGPSGYGGAVVSSAGQSDSADVSEGAAGGEARAGEGGVGGSAAGVALAHRGIHTTNAGELPWIVHVACLFLLHFELLLSTVGIVNAAFLGCFRDSRLKVWCKSILTKTRGTVFKRQKL